MPPPPKGRGVLPVTAAQTKKPVKQLQPQLPAPRLRLIIRRLPPGLTETEFWNCLGTEWQANQGKIDVAAFKPGKISRDLAKSSKPARAYLKVKDAAYIQVLSEHVRTVNFQDAKNTTTDTCLLGPPSLEFAPYGKTPYARMRHDGRQGTIDQDPEFIDFLQSLTEPVARPTSREDAEQKLEKLTITPLVQYIKDKKASRAKEKEAAAAKAATKKGSDAKDAKDVKEVKDVKTTGPTKPESTTRKEKVAVAEAEKARVAKATQEAVESIRKSVAEIKGRESSKPAPKTTEPQEQTPPPQSPRPQRQRGDVSAAARIIGRDLGLVPKEGRTARGQRAVTTPAQQTSKVVDTSTPPTPNIKFPEAPAASPSSAPAQAPTGPKSLRNPPVQAPPRPTPVPPLPKTKHAPQPTPGAKSAFLKHANPSQGVTEDLLREVLSVHGAITRCEIDKKKGLGYVDFTEPEALKKAMAASPVKVGNGSVVVLENRSPYKKVSNVASRSNVTSPTPNASTASSPQVTQSVPAKASAASQPIPTITPPATEAVGSDPGKTSWADEMDEESAPTPAVSAESQANSSPSTPAPPTAPRGRGRGNFRGRGFRGGRGGQPRGGNRAASTPTGPSNPGFTTADGGKT